MCVCVCVCRCVCVRVCNKINKEESIKILYYGFPNIEDYEMTEKRADQIESIKNKGPIYKKLITTFLAVFEATPIHNIPHTTPFICCRILTR